MSFWSNFRLLPPPSLLSDQLSYIVVPFKLRTFSLQNTPFHLQSTSLSPSNAPVLVLKHEKASKLCCCSKRSSKSSKIFKTLLLHSNSVDATESTSHQTALFFKPSRFPFNPVPPFLQNMHPSNQSRIKTCLIQKKHASCSHFHKKTEIFVRTFQRKNY